MANTIKAVFVATMARDSLVSITEDCAWYSDESESRVLRIVARMYVEVLNVGEL